MVKKYNERKSSLFKLEVKMNKDEKGKLRWKSTVRCEPQTLSDLQENTQELKQLRRLIENWLMYGLAAFLVVVTFFALVDITLTF
jgi:hypothetical protein